MPFGMARICNDATGAKTRFYVANSVEYCTRARPLTPRPAWPARAATTPRMAGRPAGAAILRAMYLSFFGLSQTPFSIAPDPRYLFMSERHREALAHLLFGLSGGGGFVLLSGAIGAGKTTVCRCFLEQVPPSCHVAYIFNPRLSVAELLQSVCEEFGIAVVPGRGGLVSNKDYIDPLNRFLLDAHSKGRQCVLVIDEAQKLSAKVLEQLRLLTNLETNERKLLQIILIGQPELRRLIARPELEQLAQRVIARFHLDALSEPETAGYVAHRLAVAGLRGAMPFDRGSLRRVHRLTGGVPRRINLLADRALLGAYAQGRYRVDRRIVERAADEVFDRQGPDPKRWRRALAAGAAMAVLAGATGLAWHAQQRPLARPPASASATAGAPVASSAPGAGTAGRADKASAPAGGTEAAAPAQIDGVAAAAGRPAPPSLDPAVDLPQLARDEQPLWRELSLAWGLALPAGDACKLALRQQLACYRSANATLALLRQLDRPGLLTLSGAAGAPVHALLVALDHEAAELAVGDRRWRVPLDQLATLWRGEFATFWRVPAGYERPPREGDQGPAVQALAAALAAQRREAGPAPGARLDAALRDRLAGFQLAQGLQPDGLAGPTTFMLLNRATGVAEPRLSGATARPATRE